MTDAGLRLLTMNAIESCNARCCYCDCWRRDAPPEPLTALLAAVDEAATLGAIAIRLSGGEPLLRRDLPALVAHIRERGLVGMVCTAGKCQLAPIEAILDAGLDVLAFSIDTLQPEVFRKIRGYALDPVLRNLDALAPRRRAMGFEMVLSVVVSRLSLAGIGELLAYAQDQDLVVSFAPFQAGVPAATRLLACSDADLPQVRESMNLVREAAAAGLRVINGDVFLSGIADFLATRRLPEGHVCRAGNTAAIRLAGGELRLCHSLAGIPAGSLETAWSSHAARALRTRMERLDCPGCWLSCHADRRRPVAHRFGRPEMWEAL